MIRNILTFIVAFLTATCAADDRIYNPEPEYAFRNFYEACAEIDAPSQTFLLSNNDLFRLYDGRAKFNNGISFTAQSALALTQKDYYDTLGRLAGKFKDSSETSKGVLEESTLQALEWDLEVPERIALWEAVILKLRLRNISDRDIVYVKPPSWQVQSLMLQSARLTHTDGNKGDVVLRKQGAYWQLRRPRIQLSGNETPRPAGKEETRPAGKTDDGTHPEYGIFRLDELFDLSEPGEYELTIFTRRFVDENGAPAEDPVREYPRKATVRFTILPGETGSQAQSNLEPELTVDKESLKQAVKPAKRNLPSNEELYEHYQRLERESNYKPSNFYVNLSGYEAYYNSSLNMLVDRLGLDRPEERTERLAGLKWRVSTPEIVPVGRPVVMRLQLELISSAYKYRLSKDDAMIDYAQLYSIRLLRLCEDGTYEEAPLTEFGAMRYKIPNTLGNRRNSHMASRPFNGGERLVPGKPVDLRPMDSYDNEDGLDLTNYYDLSQPGEYELTFYTRRFVDENGKPAADPVRQWPLPDTVRFRIVEENQPEGAGKTETSR